MKSNTANIINLLLVFFSFYIINSYVKYINLYNLNEIKIYGNDFIEEEEIERIIETSFSNINNILSLDIKDMQNKINNNPFIKASKIHAILPSKININIKEIIPIALIENNNNYYFIDNDYNKIYANNKSINYYSVPIISSTINNIDGYEKITDILILIKSKNMDLYKSINELTITEELTIIKINKGTKIKIKNNQGKENIIKLLSFLNTINGNKKLEDYKYVDLTIPKQIIVKENNKYNG